MCNSERGQTRAITVPTCSPSSDIYIRFCGKYPATDAQTSERFLSGSDWVRTMIHEHSHAGCPGIGSMLPAGTEFYKKLDKYPQETAKNVKNADCYAWFVMDSL
jgi:hypothetical protein